MRSSRRVIACGPPLRENDLPELQFTCTKGAGAYRQVVVEHASSSLAVALGQRLPGSIEIIAPGQQGSIIVRAKIVPILKQQYPFTAVDNVSGGRQHPIGENIAVDPGVDADLGAVRADTVQQKQPLLVEESLDRLEIGSVVAMPY